MGGGKATAYGENKKGGGRATAYGEDIKRAVAEPPRTEKKTLRLPHWLPFYLGKTMR
jgi:hypothetical protein